VAGPTRESPRPSLRSGRATRALWACHTTLPCAAHANPSGSPSTMGLRRGGPKNALGAACSPTRLPQNTAGKKTFSVDTVNPIRNLTKGGKVLLRLAHGALSLRQVSGLVRARCPLPPSGGTQPPGSRAGGSVVLNRWNSRSARAAGKSVATSASGKAMAADGEDGRKMRLTMPPAPNLVPRDTAVSRLPRRPRSGSRRRGW
jgi:hypothetical protein